MRKLLTVVFTLSMFVGLAACKKKDENKAADPPKTDPAAKPADPGSAAATPDKPADPPKPADTAAAGSMDEATAVATMEALGKVFATAGKDCKKLATDIKAFAAANKDKLLAMKAWEDKQTPEQKKAMDEKYKPQMEAFMKNMMPAMESCAEDKDLEAAMKELPLE